MIRHMVPPKSFIVVKWMINKKMRLRFVLIANGNVTEFEINLSENIILCCIIAKLNFICLFIYLFIFSPPFLDIFHGGLTVAIE